MLRQLLLGKAFYNTSKLLKKTQFWSVEDLKSLQGELLFKVLKHAIENIPFYKSQVDLSCLNELSDPFELIKQFPIIEKKTIRKNIDQFVCGSQFRRYKATTGGSTGQPFVFFMDRFQTRQIEKAFIFDMWSRVGYRFGDPIFNLRGRTPKKDKFIHHDRFFNIYYASSFDLRRETVRQYVEAINNIQPRFLHGYPSTMYQLSALMEQAGLRLTNAIKAVFCGSEKLFDYQRKKIENIFGCRVYSWYGHSECLALAGECEHSYTLHFYPQYGYVEFFSTGRKNYQGQEIHEIVATGFNNYVMPLIRYRTGDYAVMDDGNSCTCGRHYLLVKEIIGREQEFVVDRCGELISATSLIFGQHFDVFAGIEGIYLEQEQPGELMIFMKKNIAFNDADFDAMKAQIAHLLGDRFKVFYNFTDELPKSNIGKARLVKQHIDINKYLENKS